MSFYPVAKTIDLWEGELLGVQAGSVKVLLLKTNGWIHAYPDRCPHQAVLLSQQGCLDGCVLTCSAHEWSFDIETGKGLNPKDAQLKALNVEVRGDTVYVEAP